MGDNRTAFGMDNFDPSLPFPNWRCESSLAGADVRQRVITVFSPAILRQCDLSPSARHGEEQFSLFVVGSLLSAADTFARIGTT